VVLTGGDSHHPLITVARAGGPRENGDLWQARERSRQEFSAGAAGGAAIGSCLDELAAVEAARLLAEHVGVGRVASMNSPDAL
jgi:hypothetical protein